MTRPVKVLALRRERWAGRHRFVWGYVCSLCRVQRLLPGVPFAYILARARLHSKICRLGRAVEIEVDLLHRADGSWQDPREFPLIQRQLVVSVNGRR